MSIFRTRKKKSLSDINISQTDDVVLIGFHLPTWLKQNKNFCRTNLHKLIHRNAELTEIDKHKIQSAQLTGELDDDANICASVTAYWKNRRKQIRLLIINKGYDSLHILKCSHALLNKQIIDFIYLESELKENNNELMSYILRMGYSVFGINNGYLEKANLNSNKNFSSLLAVSDRLTDLFSGQKPILEVFFSEINRYGVVPTGVLHIGAHSGAERDTYKKNKISPIIFVEANPKLATSLREKFSSDRDVIVVEAAASDKNGEADFNITSMDQSSSLLGLKRHSMIYPDITVKETVTVKTKTIDSIVEELEIERSKLNFLVMDIQGAELLALKGSSEQLQYVEAIQLEINYEELYDKCPLIYDLDDFLYRTGFIRVKTRTPFNEKWGDALYIRRPKVTFSKIGEMGRFGNQAFQYMFLHTYAEENNYDAIVPCWVGSEIFELDEGAHKLTRQPFEQHQTNESWEKCALAGGPNKFPNADLVGFFQYNMSYYKWRKKKIVSDFRFKGNYADLSERIRVFFSQIDGPVAAIHLRRGDYGYEYFFIPPNEWYVGWLRELKLKHPNLRLYIATDDPSCIRDDFKEFDVITLENLKAEAKLGGAQELFIDFAAMVHADFLAISNSTFSYLASLINPQAQEYRRPSLGVNCLVSFQPWDSDPLLRDKIVEKEGTQFMSEMYIARHERKLFKNRLRRAVVKTLKLLGMRV